MLRSALQRAAARISALHCCALRCRVLQSPLAGVSDRIFRGLVRRWAPDALLFTEMVNATSLEMGHGLCKVESLAEESGPIGVQLFDHRPQAMADAARRAEALSLIHI